MYKKIDNQNANQEGEIIVGLDIGTTKICAIIARVSPSNKIEVLGFGRADSHGVLRGVVHNINKTVEAIQMAVHEAEEQAQMEIKSVFVGIAGQHIRSVQNRHILQRKPDSDEITNEEIRGMIDDMYNISTNPGEKILHAIPQDFVVDQEPGNIDPVGMCANRVEGNFHIIFAQIQAIRNIEKCIEKAGLQLAGLVLEPLASSESVLSQEEKEGGVCLIDIGGGTTDVAIFKDGIIRHTAVIPFGGDVITEDIRKGCMIMRDHAEALKVKFGSALIVMNDENKVITIPGLRDRQPKEISFRNLAGIIQARVEEIFEQVYFEIKASGYQKELIGGIVLTGGGSQLKDIRQLVEFSTGIETRIGMPIEHLSASVTDAVKSPMYATSLGLALMGKEIMQYELNKHQAVQPISKVAENNYKRAQETQMKQEETAVEEESAVEQERKKSRFWLLDSIKDFLRDESDFD